MFIFNVFNKFIEQLQSFSAATKKMLIFDSRVIIYTGFNFLWLKYINS